MDIFKLSEQLDFMLQIAHSTQKEMDHPNTPQWVKQQAGGLVYTLEVELTPSERDLLANIEKILAGNGKIESIKQDAMHVFEANKYGYYFITTDNRILSRSGMIRKICHVVILKPSEFLVLVKRHASDKTH